MGFRHVVLFRWNDSADDKSRTDLLEVLNGLPAQIPEILGYRASADAGLAEGNWDFVIVADFADQAGFEIYRDHPVHQAVITERIRPLVADRAAAQVRTDGGA